MATKSLQLKAVVGIWPANAVGDDIQVCQCTDIATSSFSHSKSFKHGQRLDYQGSPSGAP